jgi:hypothetical protein
MVGGAWTEICAGPFSKKKEICDGMASATTLDEVMEVHETFLFSIQ